MKHIPNVYDPTWHPRYTRHKWFDSARIEHFLFSAISQPTPHRSHSSDFVINPVPWHRKKRKISILMMLEHSNCCHNKSESYMPYVIGIISSSRIFLLIFVPFRGKLSKCWQRTECEGDLIWLIQGMETPKKYWNSFEYLTFKIFLKILSSVEILHLN